VISDVEKWVE